MEHQISETWQVSETLSEVAEAYVLGHLTPECNEEYEKHLLVCGACRQEVELLAEFIETLRLAVDGIDPLPPWAILGSRD
jgi:anti-sigma factor RsiW